MDVVTSGGLGGSEGKVWGLLLPSCRTGCVTSGKSSNLLDSLFALQWGTVNCVPEKVPWSRVSEKHWPPCSFSYRMC